MVVDNSKSWKLYVFLQKAIKCKAIHEIIVHENFALLILMRVEVDQAHYTVPLRRIPQLQLFNYLCWQVKTKCLTALAGH